YLLTTGRHPFKGGTVAETVRNVSDEDRSPMAPSKIISGYPRDLEAIVDKALAKSANLRWSSALEMLSALEAAMPAALEPSFEADVAWYLDLLLGVRAQERRAEIRAAQELADRARADGLQRTGELTSLGSLRTISLEDSVSSIRIGKAASG